MIPERDIWTAAQLLPKRYGPDAAVQAAVRAATLLAEGDHNGAAVWRAIILAIEKLQAEKPGEGEAVQ